MKRIVSAVLLLSMIIPFSGTILFLHYKKAIIKREFAEKLTQYKRKDCITLAFNNAAISSQLLWEGECEFEYKGEMYDVVSTSKNNDSTFFICIQDKKETSVNTSIVQCIAAFYHHNPLHDQQLFVISDFAKNLGPISSYLPVLALHSTSLDLRIDSIQDVETVPNLPLVPPPKIS